MKTRVQLSLKVLAPHIALTCPSVKMCSTTLTTFFCAIHENHSDVLCSVDVAASLNTTFSKLRKRLCSHCYAMLEGRDREMLEKV